MTFRRFKPLGMPDDEYIEIDERDRELEETHVKKSGMDAWRKRDKMLATRPIYQKDFPHLYQCMVEDGLEFRFTEDGYDWFHGRYTVTGTVVAYHWRLTSHQWRRFMKWLLSEGIYGVVGSD
tara:strand:+ start:293 stop:658 length:366 start_codon:yes stop_codon:yes gene_type:complete